MNNRTIRVVFAGMLIASSAFCQAPAPQTPSPQTPTRRAGRSGNGAITGTVKDDTGGVIPGATITVSTEKGTVQTVQSGADGTYTFRGLPPGSYSVSAMYSGLQQEGATAITLTPGQVATGNITMTLQVQKQEVTVTDTAVNTISTDPANNAGALVLRQEDLDALPDDPDDLEADLQALAGPSAGPGGNQIYIDGFTGGRLPPKESIREIRINSNPFSAEFDKLGYGRIQIFTKPGSDKFHGQGYYSTPQRRTTVSPRMDYQLNPNNTLSFRYSYLDNNRVVTGIGGFNLPATTIGNLNYPSNGYGFDTTEHSLQIVETSVLNTKAINETHFQFDRTNSLYVSDSLAPTLQVSQS